MKLSKDQIIESLEEIKNKILIEKEKEGNAVIRGYYDGCTTSYDYAIKLLKLEA